MSPSSTSPTAPGVLLVTASVGAGHNSAASAIAAGLAGLPDPPRFEVVDALKFVPRLFRAYYAGGFALAMTRFPTFYGWGYALTDHPQGPRPGLMERYRLWNERRILRKFRDYVTDFKPDLVVHTHFLAAPMLGHMVARGELATPQFLVVTDNDPHRFWHARGVDRWFLPAPIGVEKLVRWGIPEASITVSGMPIHPKWDNPPPREKVLADWRLPDDRQIVVLSGGTEFTCGPVVRLARRILHLCPDVCLVVLAGRNKKLLGRLSRLDEAGRRVLPVPFTDRVHELVSVSSLMVTKAGGISTAECLAVGTGMLLAPPIPGQEAGNARYLEAGGAAVVAPSYRRLPGEVRRLMDDRAALKRLGDGARRLAGKGTGAIVRAICQLLGI